MSHDICQYPHCEERATAYREAGHYCPHHSDLLEMQEELELARVAAKLPKERADIPKERADILAEAPNGEYGVSHRWKLSYEQAMAERDEARQVARYCYHNVPTLVTDLHTGKYWHQEKYPWLKEEDAPDRERGRG